MLAHVASITCLAIAGASRAQTPASAPTARAALSVTLVSPQSGDWPERLSANGNVAAWQEAIVGAEASGLRLHDVLVNVGDTVKRGQLIARLNDATIAADVAQTRASLAEAQAGADEARANGDRARELGPSGVISAQQINQWLTAERTGQARVEALKARLAAEQLRLAQTRVLAPDDGVISSRSATVGAVVQPGQELFRLIRGGRLEWRAEVPAAELGKLGPGVAVRVTPAGGATVPGRVRMVAPTVDASSRNGLVYVDLPQPGAARAGMFARGEFEIGQSKGLTLPQGAVVLRDGFSYVLRVTPQSRIALVKVATGRRIGDRVEIVSGIDASARVVASGGGFLGEGDTVRVVEAQAVPAAAAAPAASGAASKR
ncbi:MAG: efflux RND transporter periplasmic adaptor subunit [Burkholderiaceae bacterium]